MSETILDYLKYLDMLRSISNGGVKANTDKIAKEFLEFSRLENGKLKIRKPKLYDLDGDELGHFFEALDHLNIRRPSNLKKVDISGNYSHTGPDNAIIILSNDQGRSDHFSNKRSSINPLIEEIFSKGEVLISDFTIKEALCGRVSVRRGDLNLTELRLFPERFSPGQYSVFVNLDTPYNSVRKFNELSEILLGFGNKPKEMLLHPGSVQESIEKSLELRKKLGALEKYRIPGNTTFTAKTNSIVIRDENSTQYFLYSPSQGRNIMINFGQQVFDDPSYSIRSLKIMDDKDPSKVLIELINQGILKPSHDVLTQRLDDLKKIYDAASRKAGSPLIATHEDFGKMVNDLEIAEKELKHARLPIIAANYIKSQPHHLLEFMVCPTTNDPVLYEILPRLSWNKQLRFYHDTTGFIKRFETSDVEERKRIILETGSSVLFNYQQNLDVNSWLFDQHKDLCHEVGINFEQV